MRFSPVHTALASLTLGAVTALTGCSAKEEVKPTGPCETMAVVRLCHGRTAACLIEHTTLQLADGTRLQPRGAVWAAYLPTQVDGQMLNIGYALVPVNGADAPGVTHAMLTCLEAGVIRCGTR